jgi:hypothetical protein
VGKSHDWISIVNTVEENRANYCKALSGKPLYSALYGTYTVTLNELKCLLKASIFSEENETTRGTGEPNQEEGFHDVRRRKRHSAEKTAKTVKKWWHRPKSLHP